MYTNGQMEEGVIEDVLFADMPSNKICKCFKNEHGGVFPIYKELDAAVDAPVPVGGTEEPFMVGDLIMAKYKTCYLLATITHVNYQTQKVNYTFCDSMEQYVNISFRKIRHLTVAEKNDALNVEPYYVVGEHVVYAKSTRKNEEGIIVAVNKQESYVDQEPYCYDIIVNKILYEKISSSNLKRVPKPATQNKPAKNKPAKNKPAHSEPKPTHSEPERTQNESVQNKPAQNERKRKNTEDDAEDDVQPRKHKGRYPILTLGRLVQVLHDDEWIDCEVVGYYDNNTTFVLESLDTKEAYEVELPDYPFTFRLLKE